MSFLFDSVAVPGWLLLLLILVAAPTCYRGYMRFHEKFVKTGKLQKQMEKVKDEAELKLEIMRKATANIQQQYKERTSEQISSEKNPSATKTDDAAAHALEKKILKVLASKGDRGMLLRSIADSLSARAPEIKQALQYLESKNLVEIVNGVQGENCYMTERGRSYCIKKNYIPAQAS